MTPATRAAAIHLAAGYRVVVQTARKRHADGEQAEAILADLFAGADDVEREWIRAEVQTASDVLRMRQAEPR